MGQGMRMALKAETPSAHARLKYITRQGKYASGIDGPRTDLAQIGSGNLPSWAADADQFWQGTDQFERANARLCVELELNLPPELSLDQQQQVVETYVKRLLGPERLPHTWAIHDSGGGNPHCHLMFQERGLDGIERPDAKTWFKRANTVNPERGGAMKSRSIHGAAWTMHARATWADTANEGLRAAGHAPRFDHRSKAMQRDEALRNGDIRRAAELGTLTERHEGAKIYGMRRRFERGEIELEDLPDYAQQLIQQNDRVRVYNNELRDWARTAPEAELAERLAPELAELAEQLTLENPGAHVTAWQNHLQQLAGELLQAHHAALVEWVDRARTRLIELRPAAVRPAAVDRLIELKRVTDQATAGALEAESKQQNWRQEHPRRAAWADFLGKPLWVDLAAQHAKKSAKAAAKALHSAPERKAASAWQRADRELRALEQQLPAMEQAAGMESMRELEARIHLLLEEAARNLRGTVGLINNELTWCAYEERTSLFALRSDLEHELRELKELHQLPTLEEAVDMRDSAAQRLRQIKGLKTNKGASQVNEQETDQQQKRLPLEDKLRPNGGPRMSQ